MTDQEKHDLAVHRKVMVLTGKEQIKTLEKAIAKSQTDICEIQKHIDFLRTQILEEKQKIADNERN
jgi:hypothetical protein